jgi:hypothetical protein
MVQELVLLNHCNMCGRQFSDGYHSKPMCVTRVQPSKLVVIASCHMNDELRFEAHVHAVHHVP